ncbi:hypothetical protein [Psittacicella hinzii]|uniref:Uncharacterized protein n=1 Tax=Psittacicella hinzii TaxID=2028575 RepID=A0A3A1YNW5_9GAMM|nr:hypothetical protein [Psittacicella hinzii]RIY39186.1 hypothetical protein CKF58_02640 [Psittacicella hinzii]
MPHVSFSRWLSVAFISVISASSYAGYFFNTSSPWARPALINKLAFDEQDSRSMYVYSLAFKSAPELEEFHTLMQMNFARLRDFLTNQQYEIAYLPAKLTPFNGMSSLVTQYYNTTGHKLEVFKEQKVGFITYLNELVDWCKINGFAVTDYSYSCSVAYRYQKILESLPEFKEYIEGDPYFFARGRPGPDYPAQLVALRRKLRNFDDPTNSLLQWYFNSGVRAPERRVVTCSYQLGTNC